MAISPRPKCLFFDVFGTCVDWRKSVTDALYEAAQEALKSSSSDMTSEVRKTAMEMTYEDWGELGRKPNNAPRHTHADPNSTLPAQEWRNSYLTFTRTLATNPSLAWKTVDEHHLEALILLLTTHNLLLPSPEDSPGLSLPGSLFPDPTLQTLNLIWHRLTPWPDTNAGLNLLNNQGISTVTLSNGNLSLLTDMVSSAKMPFTHVFSAEMFQSYKPNPKVYLGAAGKMGLKPEECALVAAHLDDLKAAKACGMGAVYVERAREERYLEMRGEGIPDLWIREGEEGFVAVAERLSG